MADIVWTDEKRNLSDLIPWERNPRQITHAQAERLVDSVELFGQVETLAIGPENELYNGHQRLGVLMQEYGDLEVDVRVASRPLTENEREKLTIYLHKGAAGSWDFDILADQFEVDDLLDWGFEPFELGIGDSGDDEWGDALGGLPDEDRAPFQQMTFTLRDDQAEHVKAAMASAKRVGNGFVDTDNENSNGNALAFICDTFMGEYGES